MNTIHRKIWNLIRGGSFHGYLRTSSGYPLTLSGCMPEYPVSLAVSGNTVQNGTPAPDNPVEVQGVGDRTKNLSPISVVSPETVNICTQVYLQEGKTYTFSRVKDEGYAYTGYNLIIGAENTGYISGVTQLQRINVGNISADFHSVTFTAEVSGYLWINGYATITAHYHDIMLNEGTEPLPYEPYGYKLPLVLSGKNLFAEWEIDKTVNPQTGTITTISQTSGVGGLLSNPIAVNPDEYYTFAMPNSIGASSSALLAWDTEGNCCGYVNGWFNGAFYRFKPNSITSTTGNAIKTIRIYRYYNSSVGGRETSLLDAENAVYVVKGEYTSIDDVPREPYHEPQTFPIYTDAPLHGNGDISDTVELDINNRTATRIDRISIDESGNITQLTTPVTTDISDMQDWDSIPKLWRGTAIFTADTTIQPSGLTVKYYADKPGEEVS